MIDINPQYLMDGSLVDRLSNDQAITESALYNILNTVPGENTAIFNAEVGSFWRTYLQEPICDTTAAKIQLEIINSVQKWLPKISLELASSYVVADMSLPGYRVRIDYVTPHNANPQTVSFAVPV